jgi:hypothetical protein
MNYFEKNEEEKFEFIIGGKHQKINSTFHSHRESGFKNSTISAIALAKSKIEEIEDLKKSKKSKIEEIED